MPVVLLLPVDVIVLLLGASASLFLVALNV